MNNIELSELHQVSLLSSVLSHRTGSYIPPLILFVTPVLHDNIDCKKLKETVKLLGNNTSIVLSAVTYKQCTSNNVSGAKG